MNKIVKRILITLSVILVLVFAAGIFAGNFFYNLALNPGSDKSTVLEAPNNAIDKGGLDGQEQANAAADAWYEQQVPQDVWMKTYDGLNLHAMRINLVQTTGRWAILAHGYTSRGSHMTRSAYRFSEMGFNVLIPDARGHGESEGDYIGMGWDDRLDYVRWIELVLDEDPDAEIVLYGVSMGGAIVMMTSGEDLPKNVKVIVEDCGYASIEGEFTYQLKEIFGFPSFPLINFASLVTRVRAGYWLGDGNAVAQVGKSQTPMLFIHGGEDTFVPTEMVYEVYEACNTEKELLVVEGAGHGGSSTVAGEAYWETVESFIESYMD